VETIDCENFETLSARATSAAGGSRSDTFSTQRATNIGRL
jgi:hypothetical protein